MANPVFWTAVFDQRDEHGTGRTITPPLTFLTLAAARHAVRPAPPVEVRADTQNAYVRLYPSTSSAAQLRVASIASPFNWRTIILP
jgi:hypothetical protein